MVTPNVFTLFQCHHSYCTGSTSSLLANATPFVDASVPFIVVEILELLEHP
jgi:hypothetical protein